MWLFYTPSSFINIHACKETAKLQKRWGISEAVQMLSMTHSSVPNSLKCSNQWCDCTQWSLNAHLFCFQGHCSSELPFDLQRTGSRGQDRRLWDGSGHLQVHFEHWCAQQNKCLAEWGFREKKCWTHQLFLSNYLVYAKQSVFVYVFVGGGGVYLYVYLYSYSSKIQNMLLIYIFTHLNI